jgi:hypothetical protein
MNIGTWISFDFLRINLSVAHMLWRPSKEKMINILKRVNITLHELATENGNNSQVAFMKVKRFSRSTSQPMFWYGSPRCKVPYFN